MIRVFLRGGLGNQLFQYSAGWYLARKQGTKVDFRTDLLPKTPDAIAGVSRWPSQLGEFKNSAIIRCRKNQPTGSTHLLSKILQLVRMLSDLLPDFFIRIGVLAGEKKSSPNLTKLSRLWLIDSYCSSSLPAVSLGEELRGEIADVTNPTATFLELVKEAKEIEPIVVHIRLGDYRSLKHLYGEPQFARIAVLIREINPDFRRPVWLFSDSPEDLDATIRSDLGVSKVFGPEDLVRPIENLVLMSKGSALICSNSTFSWWAAFLMGDRGSVYYPALQGLPNTIFSGGLVLKGWKAY